MPSVLKGFGFGGLIQNRGIKNRMNANKKTSRKEVLIDLDYLILSINRFRSQFSGNGINHSIRLIETKRIGYLLL